MAILLDKLIYLSYSIKKFDVIIDFELKHPLIPKVT